MNKIVALSLFALIVFTSHSYAVTLKEVPQSRDVKSWLSECASFQKLMPDLQQFFGCPTIETFSYKEKAKLSEVTDAINTKLNIKVTKSSPNAGVEAFFSKFDGDFSGNFDLVREVEESASEIRFNKSIEKKFGKLSTKLQAMMVKDAKAKDAFYDENATWNGNFDGKPVEAEALVIVNTKDQSVTVYRIGYYTNDTI